MTHVGLIHVSLKNMRIFFFLEILIIIIMYHFTNALTKVKFQGLNLRPHAASLRFHLP